MSGLDPGLDPELADITDDEMYGTLEQQYERGETLNPEFVWELLNRTHAQHRAQTAGVRDERDRLRGVVDAREDERNRLQERLEAERRHRIAAVDREVETAAERDRLRAVVEKLKPYRRLVEMQTYDGGPGLAFARAVLDVIDTLDAERTT
jgi:hypothetical protein